MPDANTQALQDAKDRIRRIVAGFSGDQLDRIVDRVALETEASVKEATPVGWFGQVRNGWHTEKPEQGVRVISNPIKASNGVQIMAFLEFGTANAGTGFIYPKVAKRLYVPLTKRAAAGWHPGLQYGRDYILKDRVHGIKPQHIVANERAKVPARMERAAKEMVVSVLRTEGFIK